MQEFKQETIWGSFTILDLHKPKLINHNRFLWPSCNKTRLFTRAAARIGETYTDSELGNLLMLLCIPTLQITRYPYQEGSRGTQFKTQGLRPKVAALHTTHPLGSKLQAKRSINSALQLAKASGKHILRHQPMESLLPAFIFKAGLLSCAVGVTQCCSPHPSWSGEGCGHRREGEAGRGCEKEQVRHCRMLATVSCKPKKSWERVTDEKFIRLALDFRVSQSKRLKTKSASNTHTYKLFLTLLIRIFFLRGSCGCTKA